MTALADHLLDLKAEYLDDPTRIDGFKARFRAAYDAGEVPDDGGVDLTADINTARARIAAAGARSVVARARVADSQTRVGRLPSDPAGPSGIHLQIDDQDRLIILYLGLTATVQDQIDNFNPGPTIDEKIATARAALAAGKLVSGVRTRHFVESFGYDGLTDCTTQRAAFAASLPAGTSSNRIVGHFRPGDFLMDLFVGAATQQTWTIPMWRITKTWTTIDGHGGTIHKLPDLLVTGTTSTSGGARNKIAGSFGADHAKYLGRAVMIPTNVGSGISPFPFYRYITATSSTQLTVNSNAQRAGTFTFPLASGARGPTQVELYRCNNFWFKNFTILGGAADRLPGTPAFDDRIPYDQTVEGQIGLQTTSCTNSHVEDITVIGPHGDCRYFGTDGTRGTGNTDTGGTYLWPGRVVFAPINSDAWTVSNFVTGHAGYSTIDFEPLRNDQSVTGFSFVDGEFGSSRLADIASSAIGKVNSILFQRCHWVDEPQITIDPYAYSTSGTIPGCSYTAGNRVILCTGSGDSSFASTGVQDKFRTGTMVGRTVTAPGIAGIKIESVQSATQVTLVSAPSETHTGQTIGVSASLDPAWARTDWSWIDCTWDRAVAPAAGQVGLGRLVGMKDLLWDGGGGRIAPGPGGTSTNVLFLGIDFVDPITVTGATYTGGKALALIDGIYYPPGPLTVVATAQGYTVTDGGTPFVGDPQAGKSYQVNSDQFRADFQDAWDAVHGSGGSTRIEAVHRLFTGSSVRENATFGAHTYVRGLTPGRHASVNVNPPADTRFAPSTGSGGARTRADYDAACDAIVSGAFDSLIRTWATNWNLDGIADPWGYVDISITAEMNQGWAGNIAGQSGKGPTFSKWVAMAKHWITVAKPLAPHVKFVQVWSQSNATYRDSALSQLFLGTGYIDILGIDWYCIPQHPGNLTEMAAAQAAGMDGDTTWLPSFEGFAAAQGLPMCMPEWGCASGQGSNLSPETANTPFFIGSSQAHMTAAGYLFGAFFQAAAPGGLGNDELDAQASLSAYAGIL